MAAETPNPDARGDASCRNPAPAASGLERSPMPPIENLPDST